MILPDRVLGRSGVMKIAFGLAIAPISLATWLRRSSTETSAPPREDHVGEDRLAGGGVVGTDDCRLGDGRVRHERRLDLGGGDPVTGHVHHVVDATEQPEVAVVVELGAVAGEVATLEPRPVRVVVALRVAPDAAQHPRPRPRQRQIAAAALDVLALVVDQLGATRRAAGTSPSRAWWSWLPGAG